MPKRYDSRTLFSNTSELYEELRDNRGLTSIRHYNTARLAYPTESEMRDLTKVSHVWTTGDRYYKLSAQYYGDPQYWWIIAQFNQRPTEAHVELGDVIFIPLPLQTILMAYNRNRE